MIRLRAADIWIYWLTEQIPPVLVRHDRTENMSGTYTLTLSAAEDTNGKNALQRKIKVTVTQEGLRFVHNPTANQHGLFNAAFFKHNQKGERIITGQHRLDSNMVC